jgi:transcriptional regulator with XRE-family HTH domain
MNDTITPEQLARAKRIQLLREMTKLGRREFAKKTGIPNSTLQHWEGDKIVGMTEKSATRLIKALVSLGIHCSYEWLIHGEGKPPQYLNKVTLENNNFPGLTADFNETKQNRNIQKELNLFLQLNKDAVSLVVPDNAMEPCFIAGEIVAGTRYYGQDIKKFVGMDCIVLIQGDTLHLRRLVKGNIGGCYHLSSTNAQTTAHKPFFYNVELVSAAPILWTRRKI